MAKIARLPHEVITDVCRSLGLDPDLTGRMVIDVRPHQIDVTVTLNPTDALGVPLVEMFQSTDWLRQGAHNVHAFNGTRCDTCGGHLAAPAHKSSGERCSGRHTFNTPIGATISSTCTCHHERSAACHEGIGEGQVLKACEWHEFEPQDAKPLICECGHVIGEDCHAPKG